jgi:hypothetical protein
MRTSWYFVLPEERTQPSGGNIYNERLIEAIQQTDQPSEIISAATYVKAIRQDQRGTYWVDTLVLEQIPEVLSLRPRQARSLLMVHHLNSLPGVVSGFSGDQPLHP